MSWSNHPLLIAQSQHVRPDIIEKDIARTACTGKPDKNYKTCCTPSAPTPRMGMNTDNHGSSLVFFHQVNRIRNLWRKRYTLQPQGFRFREHKVHCLNRLTRRTFHEVVDHRHDHRGVATLRLRYRDLAGVGTSDVAGRRMLALWQHHN